MAVRNRREWLTKSLGYSGRVITYSLPRGLELDRKAMPYINNGRKFLCNQASGKCDGAAVLGLRGSAARIRCGIGIDLSGVAGGVLSQALWVLRGDSGGLVDLLTGPHANATCWPWSHRRFAG